MLSGVLVDARVGQGGRSHFDSNVTLAERRQVVGQRFIPDDYDSQRRCLVPCSVVCSNGTVPAA